MKNIENFNRVVRQFYEPQLRALKDGTGTAKPDRNCDYDSACTNPMVDNEIEKAVLTKYNLSARMLLGLRLPGSIGDTGKLSDSEKKKAAEEVLYIAKLQDLIDFNRDNTYSETEIKKLRDVMDWATENGKPLSDAVKRLEQEKHAAAQQLRSCEAYSSLSSADPTFIRDMSMRLFNTMSPAAGDIRSLWQYIVINYTSTYATIIDSMHTVGVDMPDYTDTTMTAESLLEHPASLLLFEKIATATLDSAAINGETLSPENLTGKTFKVLLNLLKVTKGDPATKFYLAWKTVTMADADHDGVISAPEAEVLSSSILSENDREGIGTRLLGLFADTGNLHQYLSCSELKNSIERIQTRMHNTDLWNSTVQKLNVPDYIKMIEDDTNDMLELRRAVTEGLAALGFLDPKDGSDHVSFNEAFKTFKQEFRLFSAGNNFYSPGILSGLVKALEQTYVSDTHMELVENIANNWYRADIFVSKTDNLLVGRFSGGAGPMAVARHITPFFHDESAQEVVMEYNRYHNRAYQGYLSDAKKDEEVFSDIDYFFPLFPFEINKNDTVLKVMPHQVQDESETWESLAQLLMGDEYSTAEITDLVQYLQKINCMETDSDLEPGDTVYVILNCSESAVQNVGTTEITPTGTREHAREVVRTALCKPTIKKKLAELEKAREGKDLGIDVPTLVSLVNEESRFDKYNVSVAGATGLTQMMPTSWSILGSKFMSVVPDLTDREKKWLQSVSSMKTYSIGSITVSKLDSLNVKKYPAIITFRYYLNKKYPNQKADIIVESPEDLKALKRAVGENTICAFLRGDIKKGIKGYVRTKMKDPNSLYHRTADPSFNIRAGLTYLLYECKGDIKRYCGSGMAAKVYKARVLAGKNDFVEG